MANTPHSLKAVLLLLIAGCLWQIASSLVQALSGNLQSLAFSAVFWAPLAVGLWFRSPLARRVAVALLWLVVVVLPVGLLNPFAAMDGVGAGKTLWELAIPVYTVVAVALAMLHVLGRHRAAFDRPR